MKNNIINLFVYGTLRSGFSKAADDYISKYFSFLGNAKVKGFLYNAHFPAAIPTTDAAFIIGELYRAKDIESFLLAIEQLDLYEGVDAEEGEEPFYKRRLTEVIYNNGLERAWIYWYNGHLPDKDLILSANILDAINLKNKS